MARLPVEIERGGKVFLGWEAEALVGFHAGETGVHRLHGHPIVTYRWP